MKPELAFNGASAHMGAISSEYDHGLATTVIVAVLGGISLIGLWHMSNVYKEGRKR